MNAALEVAEEDADDPEVPEGFDVWASRTFCAASCIRAEIV